MVYLCVLISGFEIAKFSRNCKVPPFGALISEDDSQMIHRLLTDGSQIHGRN